MLEIWENNRNLYFLLSQIKEKLNLALLLSESCESVETHKSLIAFSGSAGFAHK